MCQPWPNVALETYQPGGARAPPRSRAGSGRKRPARHTWHAGAVSAGLHVKAVNVSSARAISALRDEPTGERLLHEILDRREEQGLVRSGTTTAANGHSPWRGALGLRTRRRFAQALAIVLARTGEATV